MTTFGIQESILLINQFEELAHNNGIYSLFVNIDGNEDDEILGAVSKIENGIPPKEYLELGYYEEDNSVRRFAIIEKENNTTYLVSVFQNSKRENKQAFNNETDAVKALFEIL